MVPPKLKALVRSSRNWWFSKGFFDALKGNMIRKANKSDIEAIYSLLREEFTSGKVLKRSRNELERVIKNLYVFEKNMQILGCCSLEIYSKKLAEIRSLVVSSEHRNKGIGSRLIKRCLEDAKRKGILEVVSVTDKCDLFGKFGFKTEVNEKKVMFLNLNSKD